MGKLKGRFWREFHVLAGVHVWFLEDSVTSPTSVRLGLPEIPLVYTEYKHRVHPYETRKKRSNCIINDDK